MKTRGDIMEMITTKYKNYYVKVADLMLPKPSHRKTIFVTGWNEWLPLITEVTEV